MLSRTVVSLSEAARRIGKDRATLLRWVRTGELEVFRMLRRNGRLAADLFVDYRDVLAMAGSGDEVLSLFACVSCGRGYEAYALAEVPVCVSCGGGIVQLVDAVPAVEAR